MFLILTALVYFQVTYAEEVVNIPDPNLEAIIRAEIGKPEDSITDTDLQSISSLDSTHDYRTLEEEKIIHLTGLEYCTNLQYLFLSQNQISDISALSGLTNLQNLFLVSNQISDISALSGLTNLQNLGLENNRISDIQPLLDNPGIDNVGHLSLDNNPLNSISQKKLIPTLEQQYGVKVSYHARDTWDVNGDGTVDISDLALVSSNFGKTDEGITGDVNDDGIVDISDLVLVGGHFGEFTSELKTEPATK